MLALTHIYSPLRLPALLICHFELLGVDKDFKLKFKNHRKTKTISRSRVDFVGCKTWTMMVNSLWDIFCRIAVLGNFYQIYRKVAIGINFKLFLFAVLISAYCATVADIKSYDPNYGTTWMFFPDGDGNAQIIDLSDKETDADVRFSLAHEDPDSKISMWLYNK